MYSKANIHFSALLKVFALLFSLTVLSCKQYSESEYQPIPAVAVSKSGKQFVGSKVCARCHSSIFQSHLKTAHLKTSAVADSSTVAGNLQEGENTYHLNAFFHFKIEKNEEEIHQKIFTSNQRHPIYSSKTDMVIGSGTKGQSYLSWSEDFLFQQQVSYYAPSNDWINSPMFPKGKLVKPRPIIPKCLGCHITNINPKTLDNFNYQYDRDNILYGIDCEKCHGPGKTHIDFHSNEVSELADSYIRYKDLSRRLRLDACAVCHSGLETGDYNNLLDFHIGDSLIHSNTALNHKLDVHGNQYGLLAQSECFKKTPSMDCTTCHDPHKKERGNAQMFNSICVNCHTKTVKTCSKVEHEMDAISLDCISCHMPVGLSKMLQVQNREVLEPLQVRTHLIKIYEE